MTEIEDQQEIRAEIAPCEINETITSSEEQLPIEKSYDATLENSFIAEVAKLNPLQLLDRYTKSSTTYMKQKIKLIEDNNVDRIGNFEFLKKKSKLEIEKEKALELNKENISNANRQAKSQLSTISIGDNFIRKKSKLELEKEQFAELLSKAKEEQLMKKTNNHEETVFKLEDCNFSLKEKESNQTKKPELKVTEEKSPASVAKFICGMCNTEGELLKGKLFPKCKHYFHNVSTINFILEMYFKAQAHSKINMFNMQSKKDLRSQLINILNESIHIIVAYHTGNKYPLI